MCVCPWMVLWYWISFAFIFVCLSQIKYPEWLLFLLCFPLFTIHQVVEVQHVCNLPCLEHFMLSSNPITNVVDYRTKVLELFEERFTELNLDGQKATEKEKVALRAVVIRLTDRYNDSLWSKPFRQFHNRVGLSSRKNSTNMSRNHQKTPFSFRPSCNSLYLNDYIVQRSERINLPRGNIIIACTYTAIWFKCSGGLQTY